MKSSIASKTGMGKRKLVDVACSLTDANSTAETEKKPKKDTAAKKDTAPKRDKAPKQDTSPKRDTAPKKDAVKKKSTAPKVVKNAAAKSTVEKSKAKSHPKLIDETDNHGTEDLKFSEPLPNRNAKGQLVFLDVSEFRPNMTPKEVLQAGSFGGTYFRPIRSGVTGKSYSGVWKELPKDWLEGLNIAKQVSSPTYDEKVNTYGVKCGGSLQMWEESGWIHKQDPYGWFQWYCRFYQGRRTSDDERQIGRWLRCAGETGRWRNNLISKCVKSGCGFDNAGVSPVVRQTLQHWGYKLNKDDFDAYYKKMKKKGQV